MIRRFALAACLALFAISPLQAQSITATGSTQTFPVGTSASVAIMAATDLRRYLFIQNTGNNTAFCAFGSSNAATTSNGMELVPGAYYESYTALWMGPGAVATKMLTQDVACIATGGSTTIIGIQG